MSVHRLQRVFELVADAIFIKDAQGRYVLINPAGARMLGREVDEVLGQTDGALFGADAATELTRIDREILASGRPYTYERRRRVGDVERVLFTTKVPYDDPEVGRALIGVSRDMTEVRGLEHELAVAGRLATIGQLAGGVAHEVNNPLTYLSAGLELIAHELDHWDAAMRRLRNLIGERLGANVAADLVRRAGIEDVAQLGALRDRAREAREGSRRIQAIIHELGQFAQVRDELPRAVDINRLIDSTLAMAGGELRYRVRVTRELGDVPLIRANEVKLRQLVLRLVLNAVAGVSAGSAEQHELIVRTCVRDAHAVIEISDSSGGIAVDALGRAGVRELQELVTSQGGGMQIESRDAGGTRAVVEIPLVPTAERAAAPVRSRINMDTPKSILIIDDEPLVAETLRRMLGRKNTYVVEVAGEPAIERLERGERFDAIICDVMMPRVTGVELYEWVEANAPEQIPSFGFVTGGAYTADTAQALARIPRPVLEKPFSIAQAREFLAGLLAGD